MLTQKKRRQFHKARAGEFSVKVISCKHALFTGWIAHAASGEICQFDSFLKMVVLIEERLDKWCIAQPATEIRFWEEPLTGQQVEVTDNVMSGNTSNANLEYLHEKPGFLIRVMVRQNASWQGELQWLNTGKTIYFRSLLELILLLQEVVEISGQPEAEAEFRSWSDSSLTKQCR